MTATADDPSNPVPVGVVGLGAMGAGIAEVFARSGHPVVGIDADDAALARGRSALERSTNRAVERGKLAADDRDALLARIRLHTELDAVAGCGLVVEAVSERLDLKRSIFTTLDAVADADAVLATNTSSLSITDIAAATTTPDRVLGVHFFNPAPVQPLVEVISTLLTAPATADRLHTLLAGLGKVTIGCGDRAGFVVNFLLVGYLNRAVRLYEQGAGTRSAIDTAMVERAGYPMGPFTLLDLVGHDVTLAVAERIADETRDPRHAPAPLLRRLVAAGRLGRKSGRGFFVHDPVPNGLDDHGHDQDPELVPAGEDRFDELPMLLVAPYLNDALELVRTGYTTAADIDTGMTLGCAMPAPFDVVAELGPERLLAEQQAVYAETGQPGDRPSRLLEALAADPDPAAALVALREDDRRPKRG